MPLLHGLPRFVCALAVLSLAGCYSPYGYSPYSPYGPGVPMYSPQAVPQFGPPVGTPTLVQPEGTVPGGSFPPAGGGSTFPSDNLTPTPDPNSSFPPSNSGDGFSPSNGFNSSPSGGTGLVPNEGYGDPENLPSTGNRNTFGGNSTPFGPDGAAFQREPAATDSVGMRYEPTRSETGLQLAAHQNPATSDPYGYDPGYRWLRGLVDYDEEQQVWVMVYDTTPDSGDAYRGQITLLGSSHLAQLSNNDFVMVEGRVDESVRDPGTGKPQYRVESIRRFDEPEYPGRGL